MTPSPAAPASPPGAPIGPHLSTLTLHGLRYGELEREQEQAARLHLDACPACTERLQGQMAFRRAFEAAPPRIALPQPAAPSAWEQVKAWLRWTPLPVLALAAALLLVGLPDRGGDETRLKGGSAIEVLVQDHGVLDQGETLVPGDRIQIRVPAGPWAEAWVGDGRVVLSSFALQSESPTLSPFALTIDGEEGDEALVVVLSETPLTEDAALAAMQGRRMDGVSVRRIPLPKRVP